MVDGGWRTWTDKESLLIFRLVLVASHTWFSCSLMGVPTRKRFLLFPGGCCFGKLNGASTSVFVQGCHLGAPL